MCYTLTLCHAWNIYILSLANYLRFSPDWLLLVLSCCGGDCLSLWAEAGPSACIKLYST